MDALGRRLHGLGTIAKLTGTQGIVYRDVIITFEPQDKIDRWKAHGSCDMKPITLERD